MTAITQNTLGDLTQDQYAAVLSAKGAMIAVREDEARLEASQAGLARMIYDAGVKGVSNTTLAQFLGISETSVRRMRKVVESRP